MKLHVLPPSPNSRKLIFANAYLGLELAETAVDVRAGEHKTPEMLALNPNGLIPILELDDGSSLWESNAILNKLAATAGGDLWPTDDRQHDVLRWQFWEACHWTPTCGKFIGKHLFYREGIDIEATTLELHKLAGLLDAQLAGRDWLVGPAMTTADITVAAILAYKDTCHMPLGNYPNILRWYGAISALPAWVAANPPQDGGA